ncbi:hypothetical protein BBP40_004340 [Aspergillus hancockii]|nr:hypothetical protein BBP40_004340 [Aspergillus hancockii]
MVSSSSSSFIPNTRASCPPSVDDAFGPVVARCRNEFDFALLFERSMLTLAPVASFLLLEPIRLRKLYKTSLNALPAVAGHIKLFGATLLVTLHLLLLVASFGAYALRAPLDSAVFILVLYFDFRYCAGKDIDALDRPSRASIFVAVIAVKSFLLLLEENSKQSILKGPHRRRPKETTSGIFSRGLRQLELAMTDS